MNVLEWGSLPHRRVLTRKTARGLGWFSIGLGLAELLMPKTLARTLGMERRTGLLRGYGLREIAAGVGILASKQPAPWIWGRVGGDVLDLATLAAYSDRDNPRRRSVKLALATVAAVTAMDYGCAKALSQSSRAMMPKADKR